MIITWEGGQDFNLKTKNINVLLGEKIKLGELEITGPGEYEVGGVQLEHFDGIVVTYAEGIAVGHIKRAAQFNQEELEKLSAIDVLLIGVGGGDFTENKAATEAITQIDPSIVIPMHGGNIEEFVKTEAATQLEKEDFKISKAELPQDERQVIVLTPKQ